MPLMAAHSSAVTTRVAVSIITLVHHIWIVVIATGLCDFGRVYSNCMIYGNDIEKQGKARSFINALCSRWLFH